MPDTKSPTAPDKSSGLPDYMHVVHGPALVVSLIPASDPEKLFTDLYNKYYESLKGRLPRDSADDIVQETFNKLWLKRRDLHLIIHPEQYLFTMARNIFIAGKNKEFRNRRMSKELAAMLGIFNNATEDELLFRDSRRVIEAWVQRLPLRLRQTYIMKKEGYRLKEIARHMNIQEQTVKNSLQKAETRMRGLEKKIL